ncbi:alginate export family protein [Qipengyuania sp. GH25]|uniref:Alginate export family protein n=1 Tax=Qipengyuania pacifica TaxID=2860199 RepID=A0ABS7JD31_9SPHN|nr:alginate export family protein [Qipengyuania aerophila]MBX7487920.1 alginate export family protein [Qipengyuania aerophila]
MARTSLMGGTLRTLMVASLSLPVGLALPAHAQDQAESKPVVSTPVQPVRTQSDAVEAPPVTPRPAPSNADALGPLDTGLGPRSGAFFFNRASEKYPTPESALAEGVFAPLKHIELGDPDYYLTLSGEERVRLVGQSYANFAGAGPNRGQGYIGFRHQYGADLHLGPNVRFFGQLVSAQIAGKDIARPYNARVQNDVDLAQGFVEFRDTFASGQFSVRGGRQLFNLGNGTLFSIIPAASVEQAMDGVVAHYSRQTFDLTGFWLKPVDVARGAFDDPTSKTETNYGAYGSVRLVDRGDTGITIDPFFIHNRNETGRAGLITGPTARDTMGARIWGQSGIVSFDWSGIFQTGSMVGQDVRAGAVLTETRFRLPGAPAKATLLLRADAITGGGGKDGSTIHTYDPLYNFNLYTSVSGNIGLSNLIEGGPGINLNPAPKLSVQAYNRWYWRYSTDDIVYGRSFSPLLTTADAEGSYIGMQPGMIARYQLGRNVNLMAQAAYFTPSDGMKQAGLKNSAWLLFETLFMF